MKRSPPVCLFAVLLAMVPAVPGSAQLAYMSPPPPGAHFIVTGDYRDYLFLASDRPVLLRVHLQSSGRPYFAAWDDYMYKLFDYLDTNGDGVLDKKEAQRIPGGQWLQIHLQGALGFFQGKQAPLQQVDANKDGKVTRKELSDYYRNNNFPPLRVSFSSIQVNTDAVTGTVFKELDTNRDGKLSREEVARAPTTFQRLDMNEDEMITPDELTPEQPGPAIYAAPVMMRSAPVNIGTDWLEVLPGVPLKQLAKMILARYDENNDQKLSLAESGLDSKTFAALDANYDLRLDAAELERFFKRPADVELVLRAGPTPVTDVALGLLRTFAKPLGMSAPSLRRVELFNPAMRPMPLAASARPSDDKSLTFKFGDTDMELSASDQQPIFFGRFNFYRQQFDAVANKDGYIERKQAMQTFPFDQLFDLMDRDGDGKLYRKELDAYLKLQSQGSGCYTTLQVTDQGRNLFFLFDADRDNRLSVRELRTAWSRLAPFAGKEGLGKKDIPRRMQIVLGSGPNVFVRRTVSGMGLAQAGNGKQAPLWFRKMDRNNDGDLSPREFLGTPEQFRRLDADGDGLISVAEARRAEPGGKDDSKDDLKKRP